MRVRVRTCHTTSPSSSVPAVQIPSITTWVCRCVQRCAHSSRRLCVVHIVYMFMTCIAQQYPCVFACCVGCAYVFEPSILPPSSSVPAVQIPSITTSCVCIISYVCSLDYACPATAVRPVTSARVFQHVTSHTCVQRNPCMRTLS